MIRAIARKIPLLRRMYRLSRSVLHRIANKLDCPVVVLLYHRVTLLESDPYSLSVAPDNFRAQMEYLRDNFPVIRFEADWSNIREPSVVVTFDDGYADNVLEALPILEKVGVPATLFVATGAPDSGAESWSDELEFLIFGQWAFPSRFELKDTQYGREWSTATDSERQVMLWEIHALMKKVDFDRREDWLRQLRGWAGVGRSCRKSHRPMMIDELRALAKSPLVTIGAHTVTHVPLSSQTPTRQREELSVSKEKLETWLGQKISVFAYPFGGCADYTRESIRLCKEVGFTKAAANFPGQAHRWTDPYQIPRHMILNWSVDIFARKISEFWI